jgi:hypothetical protein
MTMNRLTFFVFALSLLTSGCMNLQRTLEPEPIFPNPSSTISVTNQVDCSRESGLPQEGSSIPAEITQFSVAMYCAYTTQFSNPDEYKKWMVRFVDKGLALSDQTCGLFFDALEARRVEAAYSQTNMNLAGTAATAILALTGTHNRAIFNLATALTAGNAWFENYKANYIMTPQTRKIHDLIQYSLRDPIKADITRMSVTGGYRSFDAAKQDIMKYDALCSHKVISDVVTEAVARAVVDRFEAPPDSGKNPQGTQNPASTPSVAPAAPAPAALAPAAPSSGNSGATDSNKDRAINSNLPASSVNFRWEIRDVRRLK